jgi:CCR4-NOT transcription complex subunit 9
MDYNAYQRSLYTETPSTIAHPTPHPPVPQFISDAHALPHGMSPGLPVTNDEGNIYALVIDLMDPETREAALLELSKKREQYDDLALVLWHAFGSSSFTKPLATTSSFYSLWLGIMPALLQEIVSVYPMLSPPNLTAHVSNRVCNALALLQCVASHPETRQLFLNGTPLPPSPSFYPAVTDGLTKRIYLFFFILS